MRPKADKIRIYIAKITSQKILSLKNAPLLNALAVC